MKELLDVIAAWRTMPKDAQAVLATVVATSGSTYRKPGARMLVANSAWAAGSISGGCLEGDVLETAWGRTKDGPALATYDSTSDDDIIWGFGLGCHGTVTVLFERLDRDSPLLTFLAKCVESRSAGAVATVVSEGPRLGERHFTGTQSKLGRHAQNYVDGKRKAIEQIDGVDVYFESATPPTALTIFGGGHDAIPLVRAAKGLGWYVTLVDHRAAAADPRRFQEADRVIHAAPEAWDNPEPGSVAVVMSHSYLVDRAVLARLLPLPLAYLGQLGPRARTDQLLTELAEDRGQPIPETELTKFHAPVGLDLGGSSPEEIALSIVAEIQAVIEGRQVVRLREKPGPLHPTEETACRALR